MADPTALVSDYRARTAAAAAWLTWLFTWVTT
jgi:hypothetical protein